LVALIQQPIDVEAKQTIPTLEQRTSQQLLEFFNNPQQFMNRLPPKRNSKNGQIVQRPSPIFNATLKNRDFVTAKDELRSQLRVQIESDGGPYVYQLSKIWRAPIASNDQPSQLVDNLKYDKLDQMEKAKLLEAKLPEQPWSDSYWPLYQGVLGARYGDVNFLKTSEEDWLAYYKFVTELFPANEILKNGVASEVDKLSTAEKYDLLIGNDQLWSFTKANWAEGEYYYKRDGAVEHWMGICHGWAPASYMLDRPLKSVSLPSYDQRNDITFYPSDIKALASYLWANASGAVRFIGGRCNDKDPEQDENGRIISPQCFDTNPGAWHTAIVNQIGVSQRSMVMDATYDYEVWNQPIYKYRYIYFNPLTQKVVRTLKEATVKKADFEKKDPSARYRAANYETIVGISMDIDYIVETNPTQIDSDNSENDMIHQVNYIYDIELDKHGKIIGGEWYSNFHPDFLWTPLPHSRILTRYDRELVEDWDGNSPLPSKWSLQAIKSASAQQSLPLARIVETLIKRARK
jgi:hypothetical protein